MTSVLHVPALQDNYIWLLRGEPGHYAVIVDPGESEPVIQTLERERLHPLAILCTHHHHDHVGGIEELVRRYKLPVYGPAREQIPCMTHALDDGAQVTFPELGVSLAVIATPGHTLGQIVYYGHGMLFCGDTLFSAGCGRLFEGTPEQMHTSLIRLAALPADTRVYCAHEYTLANLRFALTVEPDNRDAREHLERVQAARLNDRPSLPSTIGLERRINPFLRTAVPSVRKAAQDHANQPLNSETDIFSTLRRWKDSFRG